MSTVVGLATTRLSFGKCAETFQCKVKAAQRNKQRYGINDVQHIYVSSGTRVLNHCVAASEIERP